MDKKEMLIKFNNAFMAYKSFLYGSDTPELYTNNNLNILQILFASLTFILTNDQLKTKDEDENNYIDDYILEQIIGVIATKDDNFYYLDNKRFQTKEEILKVIRNKIAHGDFYIDEYGENLVLNYEDEELKIHINKFIFLTTNLVERIGLITKSKTYKRNQYYGKSTSKSAITHLYEIDSLLSNIKCVEYEFYSDDLVTPFEKAKIEEILKEMRTQLPNYEATHQVAAPSTFIKAYFINRGIKVNPTIIPITKTPYYKIIKRFIIKNFLSFRKLDISSQILAVSQWAYKVERNETPLENLIEGIHFNRQLLHDLAEKPYTKIEDYLNNCPSSGLQTSNAEMLLTAELLNFYIHYQYPLENLCMSKDNAPTNNYFDCCKLDLSMLKPKTFIPPTGVLTSFENSLKSSEKRLTEMTKKLNELKKQQENLKQRLSVETIPLKRNKYQKAVENLGLQVEILIENQIKEATNLHILEKNIEEFSMLDKSSYRHNRYLIEYIRNAIAHGHVYFDYNISNGILKNCYLRFVNIHNGEVLFDMTIPLNDFEKIMGEHNLTLLSEYIESIKNKGKAH